MYNEGCASYREGKEQRLQQWLADQNEAYNVVYCDTDSINDPPVCQQAEFAYVVNSCPRLKAQPEQHGWPIFFWPVYGFGPTSAFWWVDC